MIRVKVLPQFPNPVIGGAGIDVKKHNGNWTIALDYSEFGLNSPYVPQPSHRVVIFTQSSDNYFTVPTSVLAADPHLSNVVLLMGFEGVNGSTGAPGLTDESPAAHGTGTLINPSLGNISTSQFKFGTSSLFINGTGGPSGLTFPDSNDWNFGGGLFTIEMWVRLSTISGSQVFASQWGTSGQFGWQFGMTGGSSLSWYVSTDGTTILTDINGTWAPVADTWYYVAVDYDGTKYRVYVNGVMTGSSATPRTIFNSNLNLAIGSFFNGVNLMNGFVDE
ncbi:MAG TPA: LamG domain-containing protein, partial [Scandinavium sp.]|uniref:LamG domain-containing protein n=1 Tax=Scandinavium sp. TaxID=2830653 RepID=UPI002E2FA223